LKINILQKNVCKKIKSEGNKETAKCKENFGLLSIFFRLFHIIYTFVCTELKSYFFYVLNCLA